MSSLADIENKMITEVQAAITGEGTVDSCVGDPLEYIHSLPEVKMPCFIIRYSGEDETPETKSTTGILLSDMHFEVYIADQIKGDAKTTQRAILANAKLVRSRLDGNKLALTDLTNGLWFRGQKFYSDDKDIISYVQYYDIGVQA